MNATNAKLGLLGAVLFSMIALPAYAAPAGGWNDDPRGRQGSIDRKHDLKNDFRDDRRDGTNIQVRIGAGPVVAHRPEPVRYETRTETVLVEPAHYELRSEQVLVSEGRWQERVIAGRREWLRDSRGNLHEVQVTPDRLERVWCPPVYETRTVKVWVPARYETRTVRVAVTDRCDDHHDGHTRAAGAAIGVGLQILSQVLNR